MNESLLFEKQLGDGSHFEMLRLETVRFEVVAGIRFTNVSLEGLDEQVELLDCRPWNLRFEWAEPPLDPAWGFAACTNNTLVSECGKHRQTFFIAVYPIPEAAIVKWASALHCNGLARLEVRCLDRNTYRCAVPVAPDACMINGERAPQLLHHVEAHYSRRN